MELAENMAMFCLATGIQPSEYLNLNGYQVQAFAEVLSRRNN